METESAQVVHPTGVYVGPEWVGPPRIGGLWVVLQCPGRTEGVIGRPIVGQSGRLLRGWINQAGIENYYITNMCKYVPPAGRNDPTKEEIAACDAEIAEELARWQPKVIVGCGSYATTWLGFKGNQAHRHGQQKENDGVQLFGMYHPSYVMRQRGNRRAFGELEGGCLSILTRAKAALNEEISPLYTWRWM